MQDEAGSAVAGGGPAGTTANDALARAHAALLDDRSLQFDRNALEPPDVPGWLRWIGDFLEAISPALTWLFWGGLIVVAGLILFAIGREVLALRAPRPKPDRPVEPVATEWRPEPSAARDLLARADALAAGGRYAEAAHLLLLRSVEDMQAHQPRALKVSMTAREIASLRTMPEVARPAFTLIARVVERSLFGGAAVEAGDFADCRRAYEAFALPAGWTP
jgi:hypothetical protein